jgi:ribosomal protein L24
MFGNKINKYLSSTRSLINLKACYYGRKFTIKKIDTTPIYPGDNVIVYPVYHGLKLTPFEQKLLAKKKEFQDECQIKYGQVIKVLRKKHQVIVSGVNRKEVYASPEEFFADFEKKNFANIQPKYKFMPIDIRRVKLRNPHEKDFVPMEVYTKKDEDGRTQRYAVETNEPVPINIPYKSYYDRHFEKKEGPKDTTPELTLQKTYYGEDYVAIAQEFLARLREKKEVENLLFLKDK